MNVLDTVNPLQGTDSDQSFSTGNTSPLVGTPRGLTYWTPQTSDGRFIFDRRAVKLTGFRATHSPSPWMGDYGHFDVMPVVGDVGRTPAARASAYRTDQQYARPHLYRTTLLHYGVDVEMTASRSCAVFRFTFPPDAGDRAAIVIQTGAAEAVSDGEVRVIRNGDRVRLIGRSSSNHGGVPGNFACHFVAEIDGVEIVGQGVFDDRAGGDCEAGSAQRAGPRAGAFVRIHPRGPVVVRVATSFIGHEQALLNLNREVTGRSFDAVAQSTGDRWKQWLNRIAADGGTAADRTCLYTAMYRVGLFPMAMHEFNANDAAHHYSPYTGRLHSGVLYTNNGFWDTYRTVYPLLAIIDRDGFGEIVDGFLQAYRQGGWLPRWASPGYRDCMIGSHSDVVIAEAVAHGIDGFDYEEAYEAIRRNAFDIPSNAGAYGRVALDEYTRLGYVPVEATPYSVSWTLDNAHCDWCIAQVARHVGRREDEQLLLARSGNYRSLWHKASGFMRPRHRDGRWAEPWSEFEWGHSYVEGGPWQHSLHVPHDLAGLAALFGGPDRLMDRVDQMLTTPPHFARGHYAEEIHEMTEMALARDAAGKSFGQYAHSNQPVHAFLAIPAALGHPQRSARHIARVMRALYTPDRLAGDEDNGEMSAWYVLAALGQIAPCPGSGQTVAVNTGIFQRAHATTERPRPKLRANRLTSPTCRTSNTPV